MSQRHPSRRISAPWRAAWLVAALATPAAHGQQVATREDLARDKPATASSYQDDAKAAGAAFDGEPESRWCASDGSAPQWLQVDLGRPEALTGCRIVWESDGVAYRYKVEGSVDGKAWSNLVDATNSTDAHQSQVHPLRDATARHIKLTVTGLPEGQWASLFEFQVFGTRPAPAVAKKPAGNVAADSILKEIKLPPGFEATVFAAPPDVKYPTCLVATPQGEVFVGIDENGSLDAKPERGRVVRCVDRDGDGKADSFNVFATMDSPRGLVWDDGTLYVLHPPQLSAYRDTDGDGKADQSEVLVDGIGFTLQYRGADHTTNGIRLGIDGYLYIAVGDYGFVKAQGKDGGPLQMLGGGVARVRTDGTGLEIVSRGQRNIYDVAISPKMDLFTRDNTNDGDGWDVRLSHVVPSGHYGYPSLFKRFGDEIIQPLADYGGGSPCGSIYLDEPGYPAPYNDTLYTCEWGRGGVFRHPLKPKGATFEAGQEPFITMPRPTDIDVDGSGRMFISSWRDGGYTYSKPTVGYVIRVVPKGLKAKPFPDLKKADAAGLVAAIASDSSVLRLAAQRELLRRRADLVPAQSLQGVIRSTTAGLNGRIAALFTLAQTRTPAADSFLVTVIDKNPELREFAIRALCDQYPGRHPGLSTGDSWGAISDKDPRVRLAAVVTTGRHLPSDWPKLLSKSPPPTTLFAATADPDPVVAHAAVKAIVRMGAAQHCVEFLRQGRADAEMRGIVQALGEMHDPKSVAPLADLAGSSTAKPEARRAALKALCRMYYTEAPYEAGKWWGTRPDTGGPYYKPVTWEGSEAIGRALRSALKQADPETRKFLLNEMLRDRLDFEEATPLAVQLAETDPAMRSAVVGLFAARPQLSADAIRFLAAPTPDASTRVAAIRGLLKHQNQPEARAAALDALAAVGTAPEPNPDLAGLWAEYAREGRHARDLARFVKLAEGADAGQATLGYAILLGVASNAKAPEPAKAEAEAALDRAGRDPARLPRLLRAAGLLKANGYADKVRAALADNRTEVKEAAEFAARRLNIAAATAATKPGPKVRPIAATPYDAVLAAALKDPGDAALGAQLFERQGCVNCHAVTKAGPLKGPYLGDVAARYARAELVESILKPSARIAQGFETQKLGLADGRTLEGFVVREAGDELELRNSTGNVVVVPKADIEERGKSELSVMPQGLMDPLTPHDLASLLAYFESIKGK